VKVLAVVPARGGSKGIPLKNLQPLAGRPLITYTIEEARKSRCVDRLVVSTDHEDIAKVARAAGAQVIVRPPELATDEAPTELALLHVLDALNAAESYDPDAVLTLEPTSPLRTTRLIDRCVEALMSIDEGDSVISVTETRECFGEIVDGRFDYLVKGQPRRRQDRKPLYKESSTVYLTRTETLRRCRSVIGERLLAVVADEDEAIDINTPLDFVIAEAVLRWRQVRSKEFAGD
jgi:CMP-N-acetylneuraminic acid synthetase